MDTGKIRLRAHVKKFQGDWPNRVSGLRIQSSGPQPQAFDVDIPVQASGATAALNPVSTGGVAFAGPRLWQMLLYAFIGGLILNVMPCVLPVIALKILGFVGQSKEHPGRVRRLGLIYAAGVLVS